MKAKGGELKASTVLLAGSPSVLGWLGPICLGGEDRKHDTFLIASPSQKTACHLGPEMRIKWPWKADLLVPGPQNCSLPSRHKELWEPTRGYHAWVEKRNWMGKLKHWTI